MLKQSQTYNGFYLTNKPIFKRLYEEYIITNYKGHPMPEYIVELWLHANLNRVYMQDIKMIETFISYIKELTLKQEALWQKAKSIPTDDWTRESYERAIMINRFAVKSYRAAIRQITLNY